MSTQPMLTVPTSDGVVITADTVAPTASVISEQMSNVDAKANSFRRACAALLIFSVLCARPWSLIGFFAAIAVFCASNTKSLLCRARLARFLSGAIVLIASFAFIHLAMSINSGKPQAISDEVRVQCVKMPADTFEWAKQLVEKNACKHMRLALLSRDSDNDMTVADSHNTTLLSAAEAWSQPDVCKKVAHFAARSAKAMMFGAALAHVLLLMSAIVVVKRACRLRCAAYKAGLLKWRCACKSTCKPAAVVTPDRKEAA